MNNQNFYINRDVIEEIPCINWQEFVNLPFSNEDKNLLFRGQSNSSINSEDSKNGQIYSLQTTFQRDYFGGDLEELNRILDYFIKLKDKYSYLKDLDIPTSGNYLPLILLLRHAGVPMPVLDVTFDPITALYFAVSGIVKTCGVNDCKDQNDIRYASIFEFNKATLKQYYGAEEIKYVKNYEIGKGEKILLITDLGEIERHKDYIENMKLQNGAFIFLDSPHSIDNHLYNKDIGVETLPKAIKHYKIPYNSIIPEWGKDDTVFKDLVNKGKTGYNLFADAEALKFDFKNPLS
ncbi:MAG: FRG domain-containing protein [Bacteroidia bacterium]